jgi:hypothetical protein
VVVIVAGFYALAHWPAEDHVAGPTNREQVKRMASDLRELLTEDDGFAYVPLYGLPPAIDFYLARPGHALPYDFGFDPGQRTAIEQFVNDRLARCQAVIVYEDDMASIGRYLCCHPIAWPYAHALADWVRRSDSGYRLAASYRFSDRSPPLIEWSDPRFGKLAAATYRLGDNNRRGWTVHLYLRVTSSRSLAHASQ